MMMIDDDDAATSLKLKPLQEHKLCVHSYQN